MSTIRRTFVVFLLLSSLGLAQHTSATRPIAPGVTYASLQQTEGPWEVRTFHLDRGNERVRLDVALGAGKVQGVEVLTGIVKRETQEDDYPVAGVNADFFVMGGHPSAGVLCGLTVRRGELIMTARGRPAFALLEDGTPRIGVFNTSGTLTTPHGTAPIGGINQDVPKNTACLYTPIWGWAQEQGCVAVKLDDLPLRTMGTWRGKVSEIVPPGTSREARDGEALIRANGDAATVVSKLAVGDDVEVSLSTGKLDRCIQAAVGGSHVLIRRNKTIPPDNPRAPRHPRTAVGYNDTQLILVTVDGRQPGWSVGMRLRELAKLMKQLGCTDAMNLDGGGSSTAWVRGKVVNRPSDGGQRRIANALLIRSTAPHGPLAQLLVSPDSITALGVMGTDPGSVPVFVPLQMRALDEWYNPVGGAAAIKATVLAQDGGQAQVTAEYADGELRIGGGPGEAVVTLARADAPDVTAEVRVRVLERCARLEIAPPLAQLCAGETVRLAATGLAEDGERVWLPKGALRWEVEGEGVAALGDGLFKAARPSARAIIAANAGQAKGQAEIQVAGRFPVESFEAEPAVSFAKYPDSDALSGKIETVETDAGEGARYCRLTYDLRKPSGTRAAYLRLDRPIGTALKLSLLARGTGTTPAWLRVAIVDGNGSRHTMTLAGKLDWGKEWRRVEVRLPDGIKPPLQWQSLYVVATAGKTGKGYVDVDGLEVERVEEE